MGEKAGLHVVLSSGGRGTTSYVLELDDGNDSFVSSGRPVEQSCCLKMGVWPDSGFSFLRLGWIAPTSCIHDLDTFCVYGF